MAVGAALWRALPIWRVEKDVKGHLLDPDAAKFYEVTFNPAKGAGCGIVNAKNRMGGYTGKTHFLLFADGMIQFEPTDDEEGATADRRNEMTEKRIAYLRLVEFYCVQK